MRRVIQRLGAAALLWVGCNWGQLSVAAGTAVSDLVPAGTPVLPVVAGPAQPFALSEVRLLPGPFYDAMLRDQKYLLFLEPDRLLRNFRANVGLPSTATPYGGWEAPDCELRGHALGH